MYMRISIAAQSWLSVPPAPAWIFEIGCRCRRPRPTAAPRARARATSAFSAGSAFSASATMPASPSASPSSISSTLSASRLLELRDGADALVEVAGARASAPAPSADRSRSRDLRPWRSARRGGSGRYPSQRCLLSSPMDCLISSTSVAISARMASDLFRR